MAVTSKNLRTGRSDSSQQRPALPKVSERAQKSWEALRRSSLGVSLLLALLLTLVFALMGGWVQVKLDDLRYGRPRMDKLAAFVGHEQQAGMPTQFIALNLNRRVVVLEFPGGDASDVRTLVGPYLFGRGEDLTPATLEVRDLNGDQLPELLVTVKDEVLVYINEAGGYRPLQPEEHGQFIGALAGE